MLTNKLLEILPLVYLKKKITNAQSYLKSKYSCVAMG